MSKSERTTAYEARLKVKQVLRQTPGRVTPERIAELLAQVHLQDQIQRVNTLNGPFPVLNTTDLSSNNH